MNKRRYEISSIRELEDLDWEFKKFRLNGINNIHWFPGSYIPQIPSLLISSLTKPRDIIFDPFCGSGTTLVEAARVGRIASGIDSNPLACLLTKVKITYLDPSHLKNKLEKVFNSINKTSKNQILIPTFSNRDNWFHKETLRDLGNIFYFINHESDGDIKDFLLVCFSSILKRCSSQEDHYTYVADNMFSKDITTIKYINAKEIFAKALSKNYHALTEFYDEIKLQEIEPRDLLQKCKVYNCDARDMSKIDDESIDMIVTSPPYANVTDYTTGNRLSFYWIDPSAFTRAKEVEIGARWKRARRTSISDYIADMFTCFAEIRRVLKRDSLFCCVLGETSSINKKINPTKELIDLAAKKLKFELLSDNISRNIYAKRIRAVRGVTKEHILIFRKR